MNANKKIRLLHLPSDQSGVGMYRNVWPAQEIINKFDDKFYVEINMQPDFNDTDYFKGFDIIHFHRQLGPFERVNEIFKELKNAGVILIGDLDDFFPGPHHPSYQLSVTQQIESKVKSVLSKCDWLTTTREIFAKELRKTNKNVMVIPNSIDV